MNKKVLIAIISGVVLVVLLAVFVIAIALGVGLGVGLSNDDGGDGGGSGGGGSDIYPGGINAVCSDGSAITNDPSVSVEFLRNINRGTNWFAGVTVYDLDGDGKEEVIVADNSVSVYDNEYNLLDTAAGNAQRIYSPIVVTNFGGGSGVLVVAGQNNNLVAYSWDSTDKQLIEEWTVTPHNEYEIRSVAAGDLNNDGTIEIIISTTSFEVQVYVYNADGTIFQAPGQNPSWPRYNSLDVDRNGMGHTGYGCYGLNVGIGNIDGDSELEVLVTYDNHHIQAFKANGYAIDASTYYTNPQSQEFYFGWNLTWGQFIRWESADIEYKHYHTHEYYPNPTSDNWLQWTASPPSVADIDGDGEMEVIGIPNVEYENGGGDYITIYYTLMVLKGDYRDDSATRKENFVNLYKGGKPIPPALYPPTGVPSPVIVNIIGDSKLEIIATLNDGSMYCFNTSGQVLWRYDYSHGLKVIYSSEPVIADLNDDGSPEIIFTTYGSPNVASGFLIILAADGRELYNVPLDTRGNNNGNGNGAPAAPTVADVDNDGELEVYIPSFEHGVDIYVLKNSTTSCVLWPSARGGNLRQGRLTP